MDAASRRRVEQTSLRRRPAEEELIAVCWVQDLGEQEREDMERESMGIRSGCDTRTVDQDFQSDFIKNPGSELSKPGKIL